MVSTINARADACLARTPILNFVYDVLFVGEVSIESVKDLLNALGLLSALLLASSAAIPTSVGEEELIDASARHQKCWLAHVSDELGAAQFLLDRSVLSVSTLSGSVLMVIFTYMSLAGLSLGDHTEKQAAAQYSCWYSWNKWLILATIIATAMGVTSFVLCMWSLVVVKFPNDVEECTLDERSGTKLGKAAILANTLLGVFIAGPVLWASWVHYRLLTHKSASVVAAIDPVALLQDLKMTEHQGAFRAARVDAEVLRYMEKDDFFKLNLPLGDCIKIWNEVEMRREAKSSASKFTTSTGQGAGGLDI